MHHLLSMSDYCRKPFAAVLYSVSACPLRLSFALLCFYFLSNPSLEWFIWRVKLGKHNRTDTLIYTPWPLLHSPSAFLFSCSVSVFSLFLFILPPSLPPSLSFFLPAPPAPVSALLFAPCWCWCRALWINRSSFDSDEPRSSPCRRCLVPLGLKKCWQALILRLFVMCSWRIKCIWRVSPPKRCTSTLKEINHDVSYSQNKKQRISYLK